jgi:hypothetical protein
LSRELVHSCAKNFINRFYLILLNSTILFDMMGLERGKRTGPETASTRSAENGTIFLILKRARRKGGRTLQLRTSQGQEGAGELIQAARSKNPQESRRLPRSEPGQAPTDPRGRFDSVRFGPYLRDRRAGARGAGFTLGGGAPADPGSTGFRRGLPLPVPPPEPAAAEEELVRVCARSRMPSFRIRSMFSRIRAARTRS